MKKLIGILLIASLFTSCKKESNCYYCTFYDSNNSGYIEPSRTECPESGEPENLRDKDGNEVAFTCEKK